MEDRHRSMGRRPEMSTHDAKHLSHVARDTFAFSHSDLFSTVRVVLWPP